MLRKGNTLGMSLGITKTKPNFHCGFFWGFFALPKQLEEHLQNVGWCAGFYDC